MRIILPFLFEELKQQVLNQAGIKAITPGDCKFLSVHISDRTHKQISDTTLKRIYGFTFSKFLPSLYTLNILAQYCQCSGWEEFCQQHKTAANQNTVPQPAPENTSVANQALKISQKTLQALTNRSAVPFNLTVKREFVKDQFELFMHTDQVATLLTAPAGYGKTISLCHWVEEKLSEITKGSNDILLFLSSKVLSAHPQAGNLDGWLKALMGINTPESGLSALLDDQQFQDRKFFLVIDGFDQEKFKPGDFELLTDLLFDVIALYRVYPNFKVVLTMRSASWISIRNRLLIENSLKQWFLGFMQDSSLETNMLPFSSEEIRDLCYRINPLQAHSKIIDPEIISLFSYPLFFQYYYQKNTARFSLTHLDYFGIYEVVASYFNDKIYNTRLSTEKVLVLRLLIKYGKAMDGRFVTDKLVVYEQLKELWEAYNELISIGFLKEVNRTNEGAYYKHIEFTHDRLLAYCLAKKLAQDNQNVYNAELVNSLIRVIDKTYWLPVLEWNIFNAIKIQQFDFFKYLTGVPLYAADKIYVLKFLINLIQHRYLPVKSTELIEYRFCNEHQTLFKYFFGVEFISPEYEEVLHQLLILNLEDTSKVWVYTSLACIGIIQLNSVGVEQSITALRQLPEQVFQSFQINPLHCIETLYTYLKYGTIKKEALIQITRFCFNPPADDEFARTFCLDQVLYLLAVSALSISNNKNKVLRFIKVLDKKLAATDVAHESLRFFLDVTKADALLTLGQVEDAIVIHAELIKNFNQHKHTYTPYMKVCLDLVTARVMALQGQEDEAELMVSKVSQVSAKQKFYYIEAYIIGAYLSMPFHDTSSESYKSIYYRFVKLIRTGGLNMKSFMPAADSTVLNAIN
ncbi:hypothetical protein HH214_14460 [Mucilaginibacter robiniae]|uniref:NACHT domain-containing protein n=1 Tax=Mucilaginibacter robiniae TaxID=2728022 RepID=A0A7L5E1C2_9SPHI|nr:hypothetical protein [Mucilaginibacter robiniae]QJD96985.1 hypothetical protein HH214_14460 [Mucilaginibacter robiniae]